MADDETDIEGAPEAAPEGADAEGSAAGEAVAASTPPEADAAAPEPDETAAEAVASASDQADEEATAEPKVGREPESAPAAGEDAEPAPRRTRRKRLPRALRHKHVKPARERTGERSAVVRAAKPETSIGRRQERRGVVVSDKGDKTIVVKVETTQAHPRYAKVVRRSRRLHAHDERNAAAVGDVVRIVETRPLSRTKHWRLVEIVEKAR